MSKKIAIYPGTFDPITLGHVDLVKRASKIFDKLIVGVAYQVSKPTLFNFEERLKLVKKVLKSFKNVEVEGFEGLLIDFAKKKKVKIVLRGLRMVSDFEYEFQLALTNRKLYSEIETVFLLPQEKYWYLSSTIVKEATKLGAELRCFLPKEVIKALKEKLNENKHK